MSQKQSVAGGFVFAFAAVRCPGCHAANARIVATDRPIRWMKCTAPRCGIRFKSVETPVAGTPVAIIGGD